MCIFVRCNRTCGRVVSCRRVFTTLKQTFVDKFLTLLWTAQTVQYNSLNTIISGRNSFLRKSDIFLRIEINVTDSAVRRLLFITFGLTAFLQRLSRYWCRLSNRQVDHFWYDQIFILGFNNQLTRKEIIA